MLSTSPPRAWDPGLARAHRVIESIDAAAAREFARVTGTVLGAAPPPAAGHEARLNPAGAPVEISFTPGRRELRYAMEVLADGPAPSARLARIAALLSALGADDATGGVAAEFAGMQRGRPLAWGAWLGARQTLETGSTRAVTAYKVYAEVPAGGGDPVVASWLARYLPAPTTEPLPPPMMVGAVPGSQRCEFYHALGRRPLTPRRLQAWMDRVGLGHRQHDLLAAIDSLEFRQGRGRGELPTAQYGCACAVLPGAADPVFSLFVFAADLSGGDGWVRHAVLDRFGGADGMALYAPLTEPLAHRHVRTEFHNLLTLSVGNAGPVAWQIGVCPPDPGQTH